MTAGRCKYNQKPLIQLAPAFFYLLKETVHYKRVAKCSHVKLLYTAHLPKTHSKTQIRKNNLLSKRTKGQQVRIVCCCCLSFPVFVIVPAPNLDTCTNTQMLTDAKNKKKKNTLEEKRKRNSWLISFLIPCRRWRQPSSRWICIARTCCLFSLDRGESEGRRTCRSLGAVQRLLRHCQRVCCF